MIFKNSSNDKIGIRALATTGRNLRWHSVAHYSVGISVKILLEFSSILVKFKGPAAFKI